MAFDGLNTCYRAGGNVTEWYPESIVTQSESWERYGIRFLQLLDNLRWGLIHLASFPERLYPTVDIDANEDHNYHYNRNIEGAHYFPDSLPILTQ
jgi:hypothetical protein